MNLNEIGSARITLPRYLTVSGAALGQHQSFQSEEQLVRAFQSAFTRSSNGWLWLTELESPSGIADLVAVELKRAPRSFSLERIPPRWAYALQKLPYRSWFNALWFAEAFAVSPSYARVILNQYVAIGFCEYAAATRSWLKNTEPEPFAEKIVAVEAKLTDWRRALYQASRYLDYASCAWVLLDHAALAASSAHIDEFSSRGVGLMCLGSNGDVEVVVRPIDRTPRLPARYWYANAEIARRARSLFQESSVEAIQTV